MSDNFNVNPALPAGLQGDVLSGFLGSIQPYYTNEKSKTDPYNRPW